MDVHFQVNTKTQGNKDSGVFSTVISEGQSSEGQLAEEQPSAEDRSHQLSSDESIQEKLSRLSKVITKHPLNQMVLYKILVACKTNRKEGELKEEIATYPQFKSATLDQHSLIDQLVRADGLSMSEYDGNGNLIVRGEQTDGVLAEQDKTPPPDQDQEASVTWRCYLTTEIGLIYIDENTPEKRLADLLSLVPSRNEFYLKVLDFCSGEKQPYKAIEALLERDLLALPEEQALHIPTKPSLFIDKLERAGGIVWDDGWTITDIGRRMLQTFKKD